MKTFLVHFTATKLKCMYLSTKHKRTLLINNQTEFNERLLPFCKRKVLLNICQIKSTKKFIQNLERNYFCFSNFKALNWREWIQIASKPQQILSLNELGPGSISELKSLSHSIRKHLGSNSSMMKYKQYFKPIIQSKWREKNVNFVRETLR